MSYKLDHIPIAGTGTGLWQSSNLSVLIPVGAGPRRHGTPPQDRLCLPKLSGKRVSDTGRQICAGQTFTATIDAEN